MIHLGELLSAHLDGELSLGEARLVAGHLEVCGLCRSEFDDLADARAAVRTLPALELPDGVTAGLTPTPSRRRIWSPTMWAGAVAAAAIALTVGTFSMMQPVAPEPLTAADLGAYYVARVSVDRDLVPAPRYVDAPTLVGIRGGE